MSFTSPRMIRGWFTEIPSWRGRDGTRIPESGLAARTSRSESASESASSAVLDGAGLIGDSIGITDTQCITTAGTTPGAARFITGAISTEEEARAAELAPPRREQASSGNIGGRGGVYNRPGATARPFNGNTQAARGYAEPRGQSGVRSGAFSGYDHGGQARSFSSRGSASFGGGAARGGGGAARWRRRSRGGGGGHR